MKEATRTLIYVAAAAVFVAGAVGVAWWTAPTPLEVYGETGKPFYDAEKLQLEEVARLELSAIPEGQSQPRKFQLAKSNELWRLQSYHGYPAEAKKRLAETTSAVLGLTRELLVAQSKDQHARYGVVNPDDEGIADTETAGKRLRMLDAAGNVLVDLIIGKPAKAEDAVAAETGDRSTKKPKPLHYVRRADEEETYVAAIDLDISTKFSEWIEPDLLKLKQEDVRTLAIDSYATKVAGRYAIGGDPVDALVPVEREKSVISRDDQFASWNMAGLDETNESVKTAKVDDLLKVLDEMTILGVAPRYKVADLSPLRGDLKFQAPKTAGETARMNVLLRMILDLSKKGFSVTLSQELIDRIRQSGDPVPIEIISKHGDVTVATHEGIVYHLHFGKEVLGTKQEIQIGGKPKEDPPAKKKDSKKTGDKKSKSKSPKSKTEDETTRRYVMIRVEYDEAYYKDKPKRPVKPTPPKRVTIAAGKPRHAVGPVKAPRPLPRTGQRAPAIAERPDPIAHFYAMNEDYLDKQRQYETDVQSYDGDLKKFRENVKKVKERVQRLNERFAGWYYVISTQNLKLLTLRRSDLVGPKTDDDAKSKPKFPFKLPGR